MERKEAREMVQRTIAEAKRVEAERVEAEPVEEPVEDGDE